jgi:catechol 2,3-dioxygenase-like lactoylglutathione lyase family enzyme
MSAYPGLSMLTLGVEDLPRATDFYTRLGWRRSQAASGPAISFFSLNNLVLALYPHDDLALDCGANAMSFRGQSMSQNHASEAAVRSAALSAQRAGGRLWKSPGPASWGGYHAIVGDPDGHALEFAFNPFFALGPDGSIVLPP